MPITTTKIKSKWQQLHNLLHSGQPSGQIEGITYHIKTGANGCKFIRFSDIDMGESTIMEQNKNKTSEYAKRARQGESLSWVMPGTAGQWVLIENKKEGIV